MAPEHGAGARPGDEAKRLLGVFVNRWIEFANDIVKHARRNSEDGASISTIGRMAHAVSRVSREEDRLVHIGSDRPTSEVSRESAVTHEYDIVCVRLFLAARTALRDMAAVVVHADDRRLMQRAVDKFFIAIVGHK